MPQLQMFEGDYNDFNPAQPYARDDKLHVEFYMGVSVNDAKSLEAGRPIHEDTEHIRIILSKDSIIDRPIRDTDKRRWPNKYMAFKQGNADGGVVGTRLDQWPCITRAQAEDFKYFKIFTVEQLAEWPDSQATGIMGFHKFKNLAIETIAMARGEAPIIKMQAQLDEAKAREAAKDDQIAKLAARLEKLEKRER